MGRRFLGHRTSGITGSGELRKVLPASEYPIFDVPPEHPIFRTQFEVANVPQIPNIGFYMRSGHQTSEQGADSATPHIRAIAEPRPAASWC